MKVIGRDSGGFRRGGLRGWAIGDERGNSTIEFVIWLPILLLGMFLVFDAAMIFNGRALAQKVIQDANRKLSVGQFSTEAAAETYVDTRLARFVSNVNAETTVTSVDAGIVTTTVRIPLDDFRSIGIIASFARSPLSVRSQQYVEFLGVF